MKQTVKNELQGHNKPKWIKWLNESILTKWRKLTWTNQMHQKVQNGSSPLCVSSHITVPIPFWLLTKWPHTFGFTSWFYPSYLSELDRFFCFCITNPLSVLYPCLFFILFCPTANKILGCFSLKTFLTIFVFKLYTITFLFFICHIA